MNNIYCGFSKSVRVFFLRILIVIPLLLAGAESKAQLIITSLTAQEIVTKLLGCNSVASNIVMTCYGSASGYFTALNTNLGLDSGIIFTSGLANNAIGPNNSCCQGLDNGNPGNALLQSLCGQNTFNACVLDFDVVLNVDTLRFNYVFGSDEYAEYVGSSFNDVFALWISGPGIIGNQNMAILPGTPYPVTISNVNCQGNSPYYICNDPANYLCSAAYTCPTNQSQTTLQYDGFTTVLEAKQEVQPGQTYHLEFAIADAGDGIFDSGVFIDAGFLETYHLSIISDSINFINPVDSALTVVEGCTPGILHFNLTESHTDTLKVPIIIGGTATNGTDYTQIIDTIYFYPYDTVESIIIGANQDGILEGTETVVIYAVDPCSGLATDSIVVKIIDDFPFSVSNDTTICENGTANLSASFSPYYSYSWMPSNIVACPTCDTTTGSPNNTTLFVVGVGLGTCINYDSILVTVDIITPDAGLDQILCHGDTTQIFANGGTAYTWTPATGLSDPSIAAPFAFPDTTTDYIVEATGTYAACHDYDTVRIDVVPNLVGFAGNDTIVCPGFTANLWAAGGDSYSWSPAIYLDDSTLQNPTVIPFTPTTYQVVITNIYNCVDTVEVFVDVFPDPVITISQPYTIYIGETAQLFAHGGVGSSYQWTPITFLSDPNSYNPVCTPETDITYVVKIITEGGCMYYDTTSVKVIYQTLLTLPNAFTPNHDGVNDVFSYIVRGPFNLEAFNIFDRWGNTVFASSVLMEGWDGRLKGKDGEMGAYVYTIVGKDGNGREVNKKGAFLLVR
ncbi:MAG: choice-of-anchor L domain-containing protein [Chitinophagales bacterium]